MDSFCQLFSYHLFFGREGVIIELNSPRPDPQVAPFLERVNLSNTKNDFFNSDDYIRKRRELSAASSEFTPALEVNEPAATINQPECRHLTATEAPKASVSGKWSPYLCFGGLYLEKFGFAVGTPVTMLLEKDKITLTAARDHH